MTSQKSRSGWLLMKRRLKTRQYWFALDEFTEYVTYYSNDPKLGPQFSKTVGYFCLEGAKVQQMSKERKQGTIHQIVVNTKKKKYTLTAASEFEKQEWADAFSACLAPSAGLSEWNNAEPICRECVTGMIGEEDEEEGTFDDIPLLWDVPVEDKLGRSVSFGQLLKARATVVIFLRHFGCMLCRHAAGKIQQLLPFFQKLGIPLVAVGLGTPVMAKRFREEQGFVGEIYVDQPRTLYKALNLRRGLKYSLTSNTVRAAREAVSAGYRQGPSHGDQLQLGGVFVISNEYELLYQHVEQYAGHHADLAELQFAISEWYSKIDTWTSRPRVASTLDLEVCPNSVERPHGFACEPETDGPDEPLRIDQPELTQASYQENFPGTELTFVGISRDGRDPVVISVQEPRVHPEPLAMVRTRAGLVRLIVPECRSIPAILDAIAHTQPLPPPPNTHFLNPVNLEFLEDVTFTQVPTAVIREGLIRFEETERKTKFKFGVLWMKEGQQLENDIYSNGHAGDPISPAFSQFLEDLGSKFDLKDYEGFTGGLSKRGTTGEYSIRSEWGDCEIVYHVAPLLPFQPDDTQRIERKRHIGNDVVVIIFREGNTPFNPGSFKSHFNHVFIVVSPVSNGYNIQMIAKDSVPLFSPFLRKPNVISRFDVSRWLAVKGINGELAAFETNSFRPHFLFTRETILTQLIETTMKMKIPTKTIRKTFVRRASSSKRKSSIAFREPRISGSLRRSNSSSSSSTTPTPLSQSDSQLDLSVTVLELRDDVDKSIANHPVAKLAYSLQDRGLSGGRLESTMEKVEQAAGTLCLDVSPLTAAVAALAREKRRQVRLVRTDEDSHKLEVLEQAVAQGISVLITALGDLLLEEPPAEVSDPQQDESESTNFSG